MSVFKVSRIHLYENKATRAFVDITIADTFVVTGLSVKEGSKGLFVCMPSAKDKKGEYRDTAFPTSKEAREELQNIVLKAYVDKQAE